MGHTDSLSLKMKKGTPPETLLEAEKVVVEETVGSMVEEEAWWLCPLSSLVSSKASLLFIGIGSGCAGFTDILPISE